MFGLATTLPKGFEADPVLKPSFNYPLQRAMQSVIVRADVEGGELRVEPIPVIVEDGYPRMPSTEEGAGILRVLGWTPG